MADNPTAALPDPGKKKVKMGCLGCGGIVFVGILILFVIGRFASSPTGSGPVGGIEGTYVAVDKDPGLSFEELSIDHGILVYAGMVNKEAAVAHRGIYKVTKTENNETTLEVTDLTIEVTAGDSKQTYHGNAVAVIKHEGDEFTLEYVYKNTDSETVGPTLKEFRKGQPNSPHKDIPAEQQAQKPVVEPQPASAKTDPLATALVKAIDDRSANIEPATLNPPSTHNNFWNNGGNLRINNSVAGLLVATWEQGMNPAGGGVAAYKGWIFLQPGNKATIIYASYLYMFGQQNMMEAYYVKSPDQLKVEARTFAGKWTIKGTALRVQTGESVDPQYFQDPERSVTYQVDKEMLEKLGLRVEDQTTKSVVTADTGKSGVKGSIDGNAADARFRYLCTTFAGEPGNSGSADGVGRDSRFNAPTGVAVDQAGNVYVADQGNNTIRKITSAGVVTTFAGTAGRGGSSDGSGSIAAFKNPTSVAVDQAGNVYVADQSNHTIRKITSAGVVSTLAGSAGRVGSFDGSGSNAAFNTPTGVAVDRAGNVYVADYGNNVIREVTPAGVVSTLAGVAGWGGSADGPCGDARFNHPYKVAADLAGNVYVADLENDAIRLITTAGTVTTIAGSAGNRGSVDGTGRASQFYNPRGIAVDGAGNVYVADHGNHTIRKITPTGVVTTIAGKTGSSGSADGPGDMATFNYPQGVAVDANGNVFVADYNNHTIRKCAPPTSEH